MSAGARARTQALFPQLLLPSHPFLFWNVASHPRNSPALIRQPLWARLCPQNVSGITVFRFYHSMKQILLSHLTGEGNEAQRG